MENKANGQAIADDFRNILNTWELIESHVSEETGSRECGSAAARYLFDIQRSDNLRHL